MPDPTRPLSLRLPASAHEALKARAYTVNGTPAGVARDLILKGLSGADFDGIAERLRTMDRRLAAHEGKAGEALHSMNRLLAMFEALLDALTEKRTEHSANPEPHR
ncbi:MAG: hypothetical protein CMI63_09050 [Parvularcula sp.]|nr:hypothetical protein [Parvularcula sp.]